MQPRELGIIIGCLACDVPPDDFAFVKGAAEGLRKAAGSDEFGRQMAGLARDIFVEAGHGEDLEAHLFDQLSKTANWHDFHFAMLDPVYAALGKFHGQAQAEEQEKRAASLIGALLKKVPSAVSAVPGALFGTAVAGGAGLGSLYWALNRSATGDDADATALQSKIDYYDSLRREIADELQRNPPPELRGAMRKRLQQAEQPGYAL